MIINNLHIKSIFLLIGFFLTNVVLSQDNPITYMKTSKSFLYIDNTPNAYFAVEIPADSVRATDMKGIFSIDNQAIQFIKNSFSTEEYTNKNDSLKEIQLLKNKMNWELDYIQDEVFKQKLTTHHIVFKNKMGKRFLLFDYKVPKIEHAEDQTQAVKNYFLTFVANQHIVGISTPSFVDNDSISNFLKHISEDIRVYGAAIDKDALYYQTDAKDDDNEIIYTDEVRNFEIEIPRWLNIVKTDSDDMFGGTFPDIDNVKNAVIVRSFSKDIYDSSFENFNHHKILKFKIGDQMGGGSKMLLKREIEAPKNINGVAFRYQSMYGTSIYENACYTVNTGSHYLLILFTATKETIDKNKDRLTEFLEKIKILE